MTKAILAIDEGTTNSKAILVVESGEIISRGSCPVETRHPQSGWVEQDADAIWTSTLSAIRSCLAAAPGTEIAAIGISNQRESILAWDRTTGDPLGPVITWQCRRTAEACDKLKAAGHEDRVIELTGLPLDPMFPATKVGWLLENHCKGKTAADVCIGTVDSWLIWKLSGNKVHACDASNASRTQLYDISKERWDESLCALFDVPMEMLPKVQNSSHIFTETFDVDGLPDGIPVASAIGDSHAALFGHGAYGLGDGKVTFGTGSSIMTTMPDFVVPPTGITTTIAWSLDGKPTYAFEGNILVSASILPWTAELLGQTDVTALLDLAQTVEDTEGVMLVPAHVGLGAPHWNSSARGLVCGLSFNSGKAHVARAAAESMAFQVHDVFEIIMQHSSHGIGRLFVDGGPSRNPFLMEMVANYVDHSLIIGESTEASAQGAAYLAGLAVGFWRDIDAIAALGRHGSRIEPDMDGTQRENALAMWRDAIARTML
ncbi:FGGY-family carbohydrate kinase [uncultured Cohaesibacter sp.]|uniref:FGGY family carbohydrate kinase n=1 Tax=uncultured Cohaesibacter sp. TaxID=1002546 RepID=UPI0029C72F0B|nr:FGGY-family carbohydrate kinase [uncultured Cohaesibacter sp.]